MATWALDRDVTPDWKPEKRQKASQGDWERIRKHFDGVRCIFSGMPHPQLHHIVPRSQGGDDRVENLCPLAGVVHTVLEEHAPGWELVAVAVRKYVLTDRERCVYAIEKVGWERFNSRYPLLNESEGSSDDTPGRRTTGHSDSLSDWEHWEAPDERVSPWDIAYEPTHFTED